eukprot:6135651-Amphidinium_carterae.1
MGDVAQSTVRGPLSPGERPIAATSAWFQQRQAWSTSPDVRAVSQSKETSAQRSFQLDGGLGPLKIPLRDP